MQKRAKVTRWVEAILGVIILSLFLCGQVRAETLVDTGDPDTSGGGSGLTAPYTSNPEPVSSPACWRAARFTLTDSYIVKNIETYLMPWDGMGSTAGDVTLVIYQSAGETPDGTKPLYTTVFRAGDTGSGWYGASGLSWLLGPGEYWVAFEPREGSTFKNWLMPGNVPNPLEAYSFSLGSSWDRDINDNLPDWHWALHVRGVSASVVSGTVTSGGSGLSGVTMNLTGAATQSTTTDSNGNYSFSGLFNGVYTITPSKAGYTFTPQSRSSNVNGADITGQNFEVVLPNKVPTLNEWGMIILAGLILLSSILIMRRQRMRR